MKNSTKKKYWMKLSDYDLKTAAAMLESKRYLYVGFMCHQAIEKILKGYYAGFREENPPFTHNLTRLAELSGLLAELSEEQRGFLSLLQPLNIEARYPTYKDSIFRSLSKSKCEEILANSKIFQKWVKKKLTAS